MAKRVSIPQFVQQVRAETAKVVWPTAPETVRTAITVLIMTFILGIFFFAVDRFFGFVVRSLLNLAA